MDEKSSGNYIEILRLLVGRKKFIVLTTCIVTILAAGVSLVLPESFKSTTVIIPDTDKSKLAMLGGLSDLASMAGVGGADVSPIKLYPTILRSEAVLKDVIFKKYKTNAFSDSVNLIEYWEIKAKTPALQYEKALKILRDGLIIDMDTKTTVITITFETEEPQLTASILNAVTSGLDNFMRTKRATNASKQRQWVEARLSEVKDDLFGAENRLKYFREKNRSVSGSPQLLLEQDRLMRDVQINGVLFTELKKQYELIKIEEIKNTAIVNVMDIAVPAAKKDKPKRSIIVLSCFFLSFMTASGYVYIKNFYGNRIAAVWNQIR